MRKVFFDVTWRVINVKNLSNIVGMEVGRKKDT
jgi:hypothetical protein